MSDTSFQGRRVLITQADAPARIVAEAGHIDALFVNLALPAPSSQVQKVREEAGRTVFATTVDPLPCQVQADPRFQQRLRNEVPLGRLVSGREDATIAACLCSNAADGFAGQVFPVCSGWVPR
jgi:2-keto-3-deoxy-L-fuconate dehydrogenase